MECGIALFAWSSAFGFCSAVLRGCAALAGTHIGTGARSAAPVPTRLSGVVGGSAPTADAAKAMPEALPRGVPRRSRDALETLPPPGRLGTLRSGRLERRRPRDCHFAQVSLVLVFVSLFFRFWPCVRLLLVCDGLAAVSPVWSVLGRASPVWSVLGDVSPVWSALRARLPCLRLRSCSPHPLHLFRRHTHFPFPSSFPSLRSCSRPLQGDSSPNLWALRAPSRDPTAASSASW